jgi:hypothetical protein
MPKENELEGQQDMGGKHGGQAGMPKPEKQSAAQQGIVKDERAKNSPPIKRELNTSAARLAIPIHRATQNRKAHPPDGGADKNFH